MLTHQVRSLSKIFICFWSVFLFSLSSIQSQDTLWTQAFNYNSTTRDSVIHFPDGDHNQYEKILMYYSMRCKDGLVSTGSDRNRGCGEWDYSCNTNVIDSSRLDSIKSFHPSYIISGFNEEHFLYTSQPTHDYYQFKQDELKVNSSNGITYFPAKKGNEPVDIDLYTKNAYKAYYLIPIKDLENLTAGPIAGLKVETKSTGLIKFLKIKLATTSSSIITADLVASLSFDQVLNRDIEFRNIGPHDLIFHSPYNYKGHENIIIEMSYTSPEESLMELSLAGTRVADGSTLSPNHTDSYLILNSQATVSLPSQEMAAVRTEITIAFWANGNTSSLPANTSILHANDAQSNRQLNVHLPWSNSRIYWDCGNDGSGYDRIEKAATIDEFSGQWNHWAFTKNIGTGRMRIYLNGKLWHSGSGKTKPISVSEFVLGSDNSFRNPYYGSLDDFSVWSKELTETEIKNIMYNSPKSVLALADHMVAYYDFNEGKDNIVNDAATSGLQGNIIGEPQWAKFRGADVYKAFENTNERPNFEFIKGNFNLSRSTTTVIDSVLNPPHKVRPFFVENARLVEGEPQYLWASGIFPVIDEDGNVVDEIEIINEDVISIEELEYYNTRFAKYELLSFVTPYGIGIDFGMEGKTWIFDVTDFGPILKGEKRLLMDRGGEWQEDMDIKFCYIKGRPARNVIDIAPIWPVESYNYTNIVNNRNLEPRPFTAEADVKSMKVRVVTTGHGQQGEFIPRNHFVNVNGGPTEFSWSVWTECSDNAIYPQGGTWVYDRAGWCPGAPSDLNEFEIMPFITPNSTFTLDYGMANATGDSRYIINTQLVKYGPNNFNVDAELHEIISPTTYVEHYRINPICGSPKVSIKNNGAAQLTSVEIHYGVEGRQLYKYDWKGNLSFLQIAEVELPPLPLEDYTAGSRFTAYVQNPNSSTDEYTPNDRKYSNFTPSTHLDSDIVVAMRTNNMPNETKWTLADTEGNIIVASKPNLLGNTLYQDTIRGLSGCYKLQFTDSDQDGISWWANGDGTGLIRAKGINSNWIVFQPDFGMELTFNFTAGMTSSTQEQTRADQMIIYPNPGSSFLKIALSHEVQLPLKYEIITINGQLIDQGIHDNDQDVIIEALEYQTGLYLVKLSDKKGQVWHLKWVKQ